jgi:hypothetical protein
MSCQLVQHRNGSDSGFGLTFRSHGSVHRNEKSRALSANNELETNDWDEETGSDSGDPNPDPTNSQYPFSLGPVVPPIMSTHPPRAPKRAHCTGMQGKRTTRRDGVGVLAAVEVPGRFYPDHNSVHLLFPESPHLPRPQAWLGHVLVLLTPHTPYSGKSFPLLTLSI